MTERRVPDAELEGYVGLNINRVCLLGFTSETHGNNHCAHFVSHLLGLQYGALCHRSDGVSIRVNEIYNRCANRGPWSDKPVPLIYTLIFATQPTNMGHDGTMMNGPNKHMGIWSHPYVYNYSTMNHQVLREEVPDFLARLDGVYNAAGTNPVRLFYGRNLP